MGISQLAADGYVIADAVMVVYEGPAVGGRRTGPQSSAPADGERASPWSGGGGPLGGGPAANVSALGSLQVIVGNLPGMELGESSAAVDTIFH